MRKLCIKMNLTVPHLLALLFLSPSLGMMEGERIPKTYNEILDSIENPDSDQLVFDVCQRPRSPEKDDKVRLSPTVYCGPASIPFNNSDYDWGDSINSNTINSYIMTHPLQLYFLKTVDENMTGSLASESEYCKIGDDSSATVIILDIGGWVSQFKHDRKVGEFISNRLTWLKSINGGENVSLGLQFVNLLYTKYIPEGILRLLDVVIVDIHIPPEEFVLSYSIFNRTLSDVMERKYGFIREVNPNCTIYAKLDFHSHSLHPNYHRASAKFNFTEELQQKYYFYLLQLSVFWLNEEADRRLILPTFSIKLKDELGLDGVAWRDLVVADVSVLIWKINVKAISYGLRQVCSIKSLVDQVASHFKRISFEVSDLVNFPRCLYNNTSNKSGTECHESETEPKLCNRPMTNASTRTPSIIVEHYDLIYADFDVDFDFDKIITAVEYLPIHILKLNIRVDKLSVLERKLKQLPPELNITCGYDYHFFSRPPFQLDDNIQINYPSPFPENNPSCGPIWNHTKVIVWDIYFPETTADKLHEFTKGLEGVRITREEFLQHNPDKTVVLELVFRFVDALDSHTYCHNVNQPVWELMEASIQFARVHNIPIKVNIVGSVFSDAGWSLLETVDELKLERTKFPYFVARNYPEKFLLGDFHPDPCIPRTTGVPAYEINIDLEYGGTSLHMTGINQLQFVSKAELEMLFQFVFHRFSLVEIIPGAAANLEILISVLSSSNLINKLADQNSKPVHLYLELDYHKFPNNSETSQYLQAVAKVPLKPVGIHFKNWEESNVTSHFEILRRNAVSPGLLIEDCVAEVMNGFRNINKFSEHHLADVDYLLCNLKHEAKASNRHIPEMGKYLDTTLYIQKYFQRMFPKISPDMEMIFRLNARPIVSEGMEEKGDSNNLTMEFLQFYSDVNQYARANKIKFFILPAFDNILGSRSGWWRISAFEDLPKASVFIEREAEFLKRETWRPTVEPELAVDWILIVLLGMVCSGVILIGILLFRCWHARRNFIILTREEVEQFRRGENHGALSKDVAISSRKFPEEFDIPLSRFTLLEIIGQGQFGLVYKATVSTGVDGEQLTVAVKKPHSDCSEDSFKSLLSELKVLGYIGRHKHVLEFVGAYIDEIGKGIAYIATEFCKNGALQEYIRKLRSNLTEELEGTVRVRRPDATTQSELHRFAHEVALGMEYISGRKVTHGDLSTRNILLDSDLVCKIGDFGHSRKLYEYQARGGGTESPEGTLKVPWRWLAIESLRTFESTTKSDVWSYGVTLWEIFTLGCVPYPEMSFTDEFITSLENGLRLTSPNFASEAIYSEMRRCWDISPELRPNFSELAQFFRIKRDMDYAQIVSA